MAILTPTLDTTAALAELRAYLQQPAAPEEGARRPAPRRDIFNDIIREALHANYDTKTIRGIQYTINTYGIGFRAAKSADFSTARVEFARADELFALLSQTQEKSVIQFLNCLTLPYWAYFHYSRGLFDASVEKTQEAIANISLLEEQIPILHMARIQQLHNLSRVSFKRGDADAGATLVQELLRYLSTGTTPALAGNWAAELRQRTPTTLQGDMFEQIFVEMVTNLFRFPELEQRQRMFSLAFGTLVNAPATLEVWKPYRLWLEAYEALLYADEADFVPALLAALEQPGHGHDLLKFALLLELHHRSAADLQPLLAAYAQRSLWISERYVSQLR